MAPSAPYPRLVGAATRISYEHNGHRSAIIRIAGELDLAAGDVVAEAVSVGLVALSRPNGGEAEVQLDLSDVRFMDCVGLATVLRAKRLAESHGCVLRIGACSPAVRLLLVLSGTFDELTGTGQPDPA